MRKDILSYTLLFIALLLVQVLICDHIALFNVAVPFVFIYFIIRLPLDINQNILFTLSFLIGFLVDLFSDTLGVNSLASLILAVTKRPVLYSYVQRDDRTKSIIPSITSLGLATYVKYLLSLTAIYCLLVFSIEYFSFASVKEILIMAASSTLLSFILLLSLDSLMMNRRERL